jgi:UDP-N-acetylglucosamine acyltransferase
MAHIHPSSVVEEGADLAEDVTIGPFCYVGPNVTMGSGTQLMSHVTVHGRTTLGAHNVIWPQAMVGADPQDLKYTGEDSELVIGDCNHIRECASIHRGTATDQNITRIGSHNLIMAYAHVGHDCILGDHVLITNAVQLAGHILVEDHASVGGATAVHHFVTIGQYAYVGGMTRIVHDVPPFMFVEGNPAKVRGVNAIGLRRHTFPEATEEHLKDAWRRLYKRTTQPNGVGAFASALNALQHEYPDDWCIRALIDAIRRSEAGIYGRYREALRQDNRYSNPVK